MVMEQRQKSDIQGKLKTKTLAARGVGHWVHMVAVSIFITILALGCSASVTLRHLSSDVCLIIPESTTRNEVETFMGTPDRRIKDDSGEEIWIYIKKNESWGHKIPLLGEHVGNLNYEVVTVSFIGKQVRACVYRQLNVEEFRAAVSKYE